MRTSSLQNLDWTMVLEAPWYGQQIPTRRKHLQAQFFALKLLRHLLMCSTPCMLGVQQLGLSAPRLVGGQLWSNKWSSECDSSFFHCSTGSQVCVSAHLKCWQPFLGQSWAFIFSFCFVIFLKHRDVSLWQKKK